MCPGDSSTAVALLLFLLLSWHRAGVPKLRNLSPTDRRWAFPISCFYNTGCRKFYCASKVSRYLTDTFLEAELLDQRECAFVIRKAPAKRHCTASYPPAAREGKERKKPARFPSIHPPIHLRRELPCTGLRGLCQRSLKPCWPGFWNQAGFGSFH